MLLYGPDYAKLVYDINRIGLDFIFVCIDDAEAASSNTVNGCIICSPFTADNFSPSENESAEDYNDRINNYIRNHLFLPAFITAICEHIILGHNIMLTMSNYEPLALEIIVEIINDQIGIIGYEIQCIEDIRDDLEKPYKILSSEGVLK